MAPGHERQAIEIGARYTRQDTFNGQHEHELICGALMLQNQGGGLALVVCAYETIQAILRMLGGYCAVLKRSSIKTIVTQNISLALNVSTRYN
jgi:hypothetical protein